MNISSQGFANRISDTLQMLQSNNLQYIEKISTGRKVQAPSDDPSASSCLLRIQSACMQMNQCLKNCAYSRSLSDISAQTVEKLMDLNSTIGAYSVQFSSLNRDGLQGVRSTINNLLEQVVDLANTQQMGIYIFAGNKPSVKPFEVTRDANGRIATVNYVGGNSDNTISIAPGLSLNPVADASENTQIRVAINRLIELKNAFFADPPDEATVQARGRAVNQFNETIFADLIGTLGAKATRIEYAERQNELIMDDLQKTASSHVDVDLPDMMVRFQQAQCAYQAALQSSSKVLNLSLLNYL